MTDEDDLTFEDLGRMFEEGEPVSVIRCPPYLMSFQIGDEAWPTPTQTAGVSVTPGSHVG